MANQQFQGTEGNRYATQPHQQNAYHRLPKNQFSFIINEAHLNDDIRKTRMWADAQRDGGPAEYRWRPLRKFRNSSPCTILQSLADARCWSAVQ